MNKLKVLLSALLVAATVSISGCSSDYEGAEVPADAPAGEDPGEDISTDPNEVADMKMSGEEEAPK